MGVGACIVSFFGLAVCVVSNLWHDTHISWLGLVFVGALDLALLAAFVLVVTDEWVRQAAEAYADRLLGTLERMNYN